MLEIGEGVKLVRLGLRPVRNAGAGRIVTPV